jgi:hypothetical protein
MRSIWRGKFPVPKCARHALYFGGVLLTSQKLRRSAWQRSVAPRSQRVRFPSRWRMKLLYAAHLNQLESNLRMVSDRAFALPRKSPVANRKETREPLRDVVTRHTWN